MAEPADITLLLRRWEEGDAGALDQLMPLMYERLRQLARQRLRSEPDASLNTTGLVHEAYLKLVDSPGVRVQDRGHFLGLASRVMRHLLVDHARTRKAAKRGLGVAQVTLDEAIGFRRTRSSPSSSWIRRFNSSPASTSDAAGSSSSGTSVGCRWRRLRKPCMSLWPPSSGSFGRRGRGWPSS